MWAVDFSRLTNQLSPRQEVPRTARSSGSETHMRLSVLPSDWGNAQPCDIKVLLEDTASHLNRLLRIPFVGEIHVKTAPPNDATPRALYRCSPHEPFVIQLDTRNQFWCQYAYQFSHEFCHVLSHYECLRDNPNNWFHETIFEVASVFTLRRMAGRWRTNPPYPNWADYAESLKSYVEEHLSRQELKLPAGVTLPAWLLSHEEKLREDPCQRDKNTLVAYTLLPIFESDPTGWNCIGIFPHSRARLVGYLSDWYASVDSADKPFVARLSDALGYTLAA